MIRLIRYTEQEFFKGHSYEADFVRSEWREGSTHWIDLQTNDSDELVSQIAQRFDIHPLTLEDIRNKEHPPKLEVFDHYHFVIMKMLQLLPGGRVHREHVAIILGKDFVITFQESLDQDVFDTIRERLELRLGKLRSRRADYLFVRLLDTLVDHYIVLVNHFRNQVEDLEVTLLHGNRADAMERITALKTEISRHRRLVTPVREVIGQLERDPAAYIHKSTVAYFRDVRDHLQLVESSLEHAREMLRDLTDLHLFQVSHNTNHVMKTLTIVSAIFIPLTFIVGVYGMNFDHMPELRWHYGYYSVWGLMLFIALVMLLYMQRKGWW